MLAGAKLQTLVCVSDMGAARQFYAETLELPLVDESHGALVFRVGDGELRVSPVPDWTPTGHTEIGFAVTNIRSVVTHLSGRGVAFERIGDFSHDEDGILTAPDGTQVVWFKDHEGNYLSVVRYA